MIGVILATFSRTTVAKTPIQSADGLFKPPFHGGKLIVLFCRSYFRLVADGHKADNLGYIRSGQVLFCSVGSGVIPSISTCLRAFDPCTNFNSYLVLSNFSNFTTNRWCTPNTRFFMGTMGTDGYTNYTFFYLSILKNANYPFFLPNFEEITMKKRVFGVHHLFVVKLEKLDNTK